MVKQWTADEVLVMARAFQPVSVLVAAAELDVFGAMGSDRLPAGAVAQRIEADGRATTVLLDALVALGLLTKEADEYAVPPMVGQLLARGGRPGVLGMVRHAGNCLRRWAELAEVVRTGRPGPRRPSVRGHDGDLQACTLAMDEISAAFIGEFLAALQPLRFTHLLDVGGASGTWTVSFLNATPGSTATLLDLPEVIPLARERIASAGLADRVRLVGADFLRDPIPAGADFAWVSSIVHQNSRQQNRTLLAKIHAALADGGQIVVRDVVMSPARTEPPAGALFAVNMLVATAGGGTYTFEELAEDLLAARFAEPVLLRQGQSTDSLIRAVKAPRE